MLFRVPLCGKNNDAGRVDGHAVRAAAAMDRHVLVVVQSQPVFVKPVGVAVVWTHVLGSHTARARRVVAPGTPVRSFLCGGAVVVCYSTE